MAFILDMIRFVFCVSIASAFVESSAKEDCTDLVRDKETLLVFSSLGGGLTAIDPITTEIRWSIADDPPVMAEQQQNFQVQQYLPDPIDGSIYELGNMGHLKKLPYTIPQLVASAPCRSSDGILYSGKKSDTWFLVDPKSGRREKVLGFGSNVEGEPAEKIAWATSRSIYLGRTQYTVMMYDSLNKNKKIKPWNITFYDYSSHTMAPKISNEYEYVHLTTTSNGLIVTLDRKNGNVLWKKDLTSPVVAAFLLGSEGLLSVPFTTVSSEAFDEILEQSKDGNIRSIRLFQSLYIGEHSHGLYAFSSLVSKETPTISSDLPLKLLDGPIRTQHPNKNIVYLTDVLHNNRNAIILGHYEMPKRKDLFKILPTGTNTIQYNQLTTTRNDHDISIGSSWEDSYEIIFKTKSSVVNKGSASIGLQTDSVDNKMRTNEFNDTKISFTMNSVWISQFINDWFMDHPSSKVHQILILLVLAMVTMFWYICSTVRELKLQSENGSNSQKSKGSVTSNVGTSDPVDLGKGEVKVGKISFNSNEVLGKGCEGTFVFKGSFEGRHVAVKRLLPECFSFADREVALLRESDAHENVVRYFCTEQDRQFRYIAVELCAATLQDYTEGKNSHELRSLIDIWDVLRQAASGLTHLHALNIVHRDIKPQNVLLSMPNIYRSVRVMISDFGLCKKLNFGKTSFSRRSGVTGTDGWIAPEMIQGQRTTTSVDIFSLGCVYYYVLSGGEHAFGEALKRQANILSNDYDLSRMKITSRGSSSKKVLAGQLIADMICKDAQSRPTARCIGNHPVFWSEKKILAFLQDVSDRVEKVHFSVEPLKTLEKNGRLVVLDDWNLHLDPIITDDLRRYRGYMGSSVRDLLRALRNKKHHYHDLSEEAQHILGCIPCEFTNYWIDKFPQLISHTYHALFICSTENAFEPYYDSNYRFRRPQYFEDDQSSNLSVWDDQKPLHKIIGSPKKSRVLTDKLTSSNITHNRKFAYNFRKSPSDKIASQLPVGNGSHGVGLQRNLDLADNCIRKPDLFANFKFRRNQKPNRNCNNTHKEVKCSKNQFAEE